MKTTNLDRYAASFKTSNHNTKTVEQVVQKAINTLVDELFTQADIAAFVTADREMIEAALEKKLFPNGYVVSTTRPKPGSRPKA